MSQFQLITGANATFVVIDPDQNQISLSKLKNFKFKDDVTTITSIGLNGIRDVAEAYIGSSGSFEADIIDAGLWQNFSRQNSEWVNQNGLYRFYDIYVYVTSPGSGTLSTFHLVNASMKLDEYGEFDHDKVVTVKVSFMCQSIQEV